MKHVKALALVLSLLFVVLVFAACDGGADGSTDETTTEEPDVTIKVSMKVKDLDGNVVYDIPEYTYNGKPPTPIDLIDFYFYLESDEAVVIDEDGFLVAIGSIEAGTETSGDEKIITYWWWSLNGREATVDFSEYTVKDGDKIEYYLKRVSGDVTGGSKK
ncbi:MAG: DUF4430 domain-containing protein [Clostridiales bacterium]|jgi:hypothetical protein|nr:DUF4430 domain-containing protein [Clostridiales bacterium]